MKTNSVQARPSRGGVRRAVARPWVKGGEVRLSADALAGRRAPAVWGSVEEDMVPVLGSGGVALPAAKDGEL